MCLAYVAIYSSQYCDFAANLIFPVFSVVSYFQPALVDTTIYRASQKSNPLGKI